jgi:hypothetical protein
MVPVNSEEESELWNGASDQWPLPCVNIQLQQLQAERATSTYIHLSDYFSGRALPHIILFIVQVASAYSHIMATVCLNETLSPHKNVVQYIKDKC